MATECRRLGKAVTIMTVIRASDEEIAKWQRQHILTKTTVLSAEVKDDGTAVNADYFLDTIQLERETEKYGKWLFSITYTPSQWPEVPNRVFISMWNTESAEKGYDEERHEAGVQKIIAVLHDHYKLPPEHEITRHDSTPEIGILYDPAIHTESFEGMPNGVDG